MGRGRKPANGTAQTEEERKQSRKEGILEAKNIKSIRQKDYDQRRQHGRVTAAATTGLIVQVGGNLLCTLSIHPIVHYGVDQ